MQATVQPKKIKSNRSICIQDKFYFDWTRYYKQVSYWLRYFLHKLLRDTKISCRRCIVSTSLIIFHIFLLYLVVHSKKRKFCDNVDDNSFTYNVLFSLIDLIVLVQAYLTYFIYKATYLLEQTIVVSPQSFHFTW